MAKGKSLEQIEAQMLKLKEKKMSIHEELQKLAAERRKMILSESSAAAGGVTVEPEPAILSAKVN